MDYITLKFNSIAPVDSSFVYTWVVDLFFYTVQYPSYEFIVWEIGNHTTYLTEHKFDIISCYMLTLISTGKLSLKFCKKLCFPKNFCKSLRITGISNEGNHLRVVVRNFVRINNLCIHLLVIIYLNILFLVLLCFILGESCKMWIKDIEQNMFSINVKHI